MAFKLGDQYRSNHTKDEKLEVVHMYNPQMCKLNVVGTTRHFIAKDELVNGKHLTLAHVAKENTELKRVEEEIQW